MHTLQRGGNMNRKLLTVGVVAIFAAGCGSSTHPANTAKTHHAAATSASATVDPVAEAACRKIDAAVASIRPNPARIDVEVAGQPVKAAASSVAGVVPLGRDVAKLGADMSRVIADTSITSAKLDTDLSAVAADCGAAGYTLHHASIG